MYDSIIIHAKRVGDSNRKIIQMEVHFEDFYQPTESSKCNTSALSRLVETHLVSKLVVDYCKMLPNLECVSADIFKLIINYCEVKDAGRLFFSSKKLSAHPYLHECFDNLYARDFKIPTPLSEKHSGYGKLRSMAEERMRQREIEKEAARIASLERQHRENSIAQHYINRADRFFRHSREDLVLPHAQIPFGFDR